MGSSGHIVILFTLLLMPALLFGEITATYDAVTSLNLEIHPGLAPIPFSLYSDTISVEIQNPN